MALPQIKDFFRLAQRGPHIILQQFHGKMMAWVDVDLSVPRRFLTFGEPRRFVNPGLVIVTLHNNGIEPEGRLIHLNGNRNDHRSDNMIVVPKKKVEES